MPLTKVYSFHKVDDVAKGLDKFLERESAEAIERNGMFTVAFSGGSLPATACKYLRDNTKIDFSRWYVFWADERCVDYDSEESNYKLLKQELLDPLGGKIPEAQVIAINESLVGDPEAAATDYQEQMETVFAKGKSKFPEFDCILLGIGPDGHTCSLFPNRPQLEERNKWVVHIEDSPKEPPCRITLTLPVLNASRSVAFVATGAGKSKTVKEIVDDRDVAKPASHVALSKGTLYWFLDAGSAKGLTTTKPTEFKL
ncbi:suppressor of los1-1 [Coemansia sp. RSA 1813]|nr:suppressor of los1-1 [Coemansia sp. RSA 1646]KAJ1770218.1 suppressor of los1-1 [Coemansia sp. RSA 1843]KAJ2090175.1 suppressor of los1-1 [Coemansia sp. RSA 986]KAJ2214582.1 suppressor of los1-1 [Coemansia sp. RSA 487]KAJ2570758.1 suppressor of los1-1 [Coemansia sp. RSA 1813]